MTIARKPIERCLSDFTNPDGKAPNGADDATDDTPALRKALEVGPGVVHVPAGFYRWKDVAIPSNVTVAGAGAATVVRSSGSEGIFVQHAAHGWAIRDLVLDGEAKGEWRKRMDAGHNGIFTEHCWGFEIAGVAMRNFSGAGLQLTRTDLNGAGWSNGGNLERISVTGSYIGIRFDLNAEYVSVVESSCSCNVIGCVIHAGNCTITASNFGANIDGILLEDKQNGSHGVVSNCLVNHNERYALLARNVAAGMAIGNCCFIYGAIQLENCVGINIVSGIIGCSIMTAGNGVNRIAGNYVTPENWSYTFTPRTIVSDNFTRQGPWSMNRP